MCNPPIEPWKTIKPEEYTYIKKGNGEKEIDVWTRTRVVWKNIQHEKETFKKMITKQSLFNKPTISS